MLPQNNIIINNENTIPSKTYNINRDSKHIAGSIDGKDALIQSVYVMLSTQRYESPIFNWSFGCEVESLIGKDVNYIQSELKRMVEDCLSIDERIISVENFVISFVAEKEKFDLSFLIRSSLGDININWEVSI